MFFVVQSWMISHLSLKGNELLVYAVIYNYSQEGQGCYYGSMSFLADSLGITRQTAMAALKSLAERRLVERREETRGAVQIISYEAKCPADLLPEEVLQGVKNFNRGCKEILQNSNNDKCSFDKEHNTPLPPSIELPYNSNEFLEVWGILLRQPKWKKKSKDALRLAAKMLGGYPEKVAIGIMNKTILNGWQGLFPPKAGDGDGIAKTTSAQSRAHDARIAAEEQLAASLAAEQHELIDGRMSL